ncbi:MAG: nitroreductase family protein [Anaerolineae bacterium]|nr:nitroreductase family protein [Anaerolineae bacterium]
MFRDLVLKNRSYRRFFEDESISLETLKELVDLARVTPSAANSQPIKFILSNEPETNSKIFPALLWAAYIKDWAGPQPGERPSAYIVVLLDKNIRPTVICDQGIAAQTILLGAVEKGLGGCMIASVRKEDLSRDLNIPERYEILLVIALGKPNEIVELEPVPESGDIRYWRDEQQTHHVPKRSLDDLILKI